MRRIGVLLPAAPDDAEFQSWVGAFLQGLAQSGWITGRNIRIELPAIYAYRSHVMSGGLMSYGLDNLDQYRHAAGYVDGSKIAP